MQLRNAFCLWCALLFLTPAAVAQTADDPAPAEEPADTPVPDNAEPEAQADPEAETAPAPAPEAEQPQVEIKVFNDWELRCETSSGNCFMYQVADDGAGNSVAEIRLINLPEANEAAAGATVVTPLGTLLTEGLVIQIDSGDARQYPFNWCTRSGCFAQFGFTDQEVVALKRGNVALLRILSVSAPQQPVVLELSLSGFTAAFNAMTEATSGQ